MWGQTYSWWASRVVWKIIFLYCLFSPGCRWNKSWSAVRRKGAAWHAGVWAPSEVISHHCLSKRKHQHIPKTRAKGAFRLAFGHICKNMINNSTAASQLVNATATYHRISQHFFHFMCWNFCQLFLLQKKAEAFFFFSSCSFIYISAYLEGTVVNIVSACAVMCVLLVSLFSDAPVLHLPLLCLSPFFIPPVLLWKATVLSPSLTAYLMFGPWCCFHFARDIMSVFSSLSLYSSWHFGVDALFTQGYLTAISGFIFALSFGLSQRCCLYVIICHNRGGDLSLWQHFKMLPEICWCFHVLYIYICYYSVCFRLRLPFLCKICVCLCLHSFK